MRTKTTLITLSALSTVALIASFTPTATASPASVHRHTTLTGQVAIKGRVLDSAGAGASGAKIVLYAWPGSWPGKQHLHKGEHVPLRFIGQTLSGSSGSYAIRISDAAALKASAQRNGIVNLQVAVVGSSAWHEFPLQITSTSTGPALTTVMASHSERLTTPTVNLHVSGSRWKPAATSDYCYKETSVFDQDYSKTWGAVDETYERYSGINATAKLTSSQDTSFSVGFSADGESGTFTSGGSFSLGDSVTTIFDTIDGPGTQGYQVNYTPSEYTDIWEPGGCVGDDYAQPRVQDDGARVVGAGSIPSTPTADCDLQHLVYSKQYGYSTASTINSGLTISEIGFTASAQTGWSNNDWIKYINPSGKDFHTCGEYGDPASSGAGRIVTGLPNNGGP
jgi:hypothetical protein